MLKPIHNNLKNGRGRERGISLSRVSSLQKLSDIPIKKQFSSINQSFECFEPKSALNILQNASMVNQNNIGRMSLKNQRKFCSNKKQRHSYRNALGNTTRHNMTENQEASILIEQAENISQMIDLLVQYEKVCQQKMDLASAQEARKKINELKKEELKTRRKQIQVEQKSQVHKTRRQVDIEVKQFQQFWDSKMAQATKALKQIEQTHVQQQKQEYEHFERSVLAEPMPRVKYSSKVLQIQRNLTSLIKSRKYKQAEHLRSILQKKQIQEQQKHVMAIEQKKRNRLKQYRKKQQKQLQVFSGKLASSYNELKKQKQKQHQRLTKKMRKKQIEGNKIPSCLLRAKTNLLNQSKAKIDDKEEF